MNQIMTQVVDVSHVDGDFDKLYRLFIYALTEMEGDSFLQLSDCDKIFVLDSLSAYDSFVKGAEEEGYFLYRYSYYGNNGPKVQEHQKACSAILKLNLHTNFNLLNFVGVGCKKYVISDNLFKFLSDSFLNIILPKYTSSYAPKNSRSIYTNDLQDEFFRFIFYGPKDLFRNYNEYRNTDESIFSLLKLAPLFSDNLVNRVISDINYRNKFSIYYSLLKYNYRNYLRLQFDGHERNNNRDKVTTYAVSTMENDYFGSKIDEIVSKNMSLAWLSESGRMHTAKEYIEKFLFTTGSLGPDYISVNRYSREQLDDIATDSLNHFIQTVSNGDSLLIDRVFIKDMINLIRPLGESVSIADKIISSNKEVFCRNFKKIMKEFKLSYQDRAIISMVMARSIPLEMINSYKIADIVLSDNTQAVYRAFIAHVGKANSDKTRQSALDKVYSKFIKKQTLDYSSIMAIVDFCSPNILLRMTGVHDTDKYVAQKIKYRMENENVVVL